MLAVAAWAVAPVLGQDGSAGRPAGLGDCEERFASHPGEEETAACFDEVASTVPELKARARARLSSLAADHPELPWLGYYDAAYWYTKDPSVAEEAYRRVAEAFHASENLEGEVKSRINRSKLLYNLPDRAAEARAEIDRALALSKTSSDPALRALGELQAVDLLFRSGRDLGRAYVILKEMGRSAGDDESFTTRRERLMLLGNVCIQTGRLDEARHVFEELGRMMEAAGEVYTEATVRYNLAGIAFERLGDTPTPELLRETNELAKVALTTAIEGENRVTEAQVSWILGIVAPDEERQEHFDRCLVIADWAALRSACLSSLAVYQSRTDPALAEETVNRALTMATELAATEESQGLWPSIAAWRSSMRVAWQAKPPGPALANSWEALDALENLRDRQTEGSGAQAEVFSVWSDHYAWLAGRILLGVEDGEIPSSATAEAFRVSERMRARALTDWVRRAGPSSADVEESSFSDLVAAQAALGADEALLSFVVAPWLDRSGDFGGGSWVIVATRDAVTVHRLPGRVELRRAVGLFTGLIDRRDGAETGRATRLYEALLAEALAGLPEGIDRLILVPDDALHRLPFAALRASEDGEPLGVRYELVQVPSATLWLRWREAEREPAEEPLLVLADPALPHRGAAEDAPIQVAQTRGDLSAAETLGPLPWARSEGKAAVRALGGGTLLIGAEASEAALRDLGLGDFEIFHVGAHAVTDEDHPERSAVLLAPSPGAGAAGESEDGADDPRDGFLRSAEIAHLDLGGRLVVLASCRSAGGSTLRGEGVMSLGRAFFQAGAHGVVASLWPLRDDESAAMFERFYDHLGRGESVSAALRSARREAIAAGEPAAAWAGLVVLGDGSVVPLPGGRSLLDHPALPVVAAALLVLAAGLLAAFAVRRRRASRPISGTSTPRSG